jgi:hypothetical protein
MQTAIDPATTRHAVDAYLAREYPTLFDLAPAAPHWDTPALFPADQATAYLIGTRPLAGTYGPQQLTMPGTRPDGAQGHLFTR